MSKSVSNFLCHLKDECAFIEKHTVDLSEDEFYNKKILQKALVRSLEVIGEASKSISIEERNTYSEVPWGKMIEIADNGTYRYFNIDYKTVYTTCTDVIPDIHLQLKEVLKEIKE
ncbi:DUF86 domain-containing protein [Aquimarina sp. ERC-38]|uniref:HepT-like ribonuclease domain-containing protein n=1 Tax=Aquimarina sp. ERC-38 TaxID=2949996 RepID=UPI002246123F|nr:HepT-like ribonuclease domain-containing protein [Aquimarina sp. ERC-38]UZO81298.1 DUF86 domain-containing protein [Aquimarina sp. ERC-38]